MNQKRFAILFNTAYGSLWGVENDRYGNSSPGIGVVVFRLQENGGSRNG